MRLSRLIFGVLTLAFSAIAHAATDAEKLRLYDGFTGVSCYEWNKAAHIFWKNVGGDWQDRNGVAQGNDPWSIATVKTGQTGEVEFDVTGIGRTIFIRVPSGNVKFRSRENAANTPPRLVLTYDDGTSSEMLPYADSTMAGVSKGKCTAGAPGGNTPTLDSPGMIFEFAELPPHASAKLVLTIERTYSGVATLGAYRAVAPIDPLPPITTGYADEYPEDEGIMNDPRTIYHETWDRPNGAPPIDWWTRTLGASVLNQPSKWNNSSNGVPLPNGWTGERWLPDCGTDGTACWNVHYSAGVYLGYAAPDVKVDDLDEMYYRYYIKYDKTFRDPTACDGGKRPGIMADNTFGGNGGKPSNGFNGWGTRGHYLVVCDNYNPIYPAVVFGTYTYHADQTDLNGDDWPWTGKGTLGIVDLDQWVCVEGYTRVNTPGVRNGVVTQWLNGREVLHREGIYFRGVKPAIGYGNWYAPTNATQLAQYEAMGLPRIDDPVSGKTVFFRGGTTAYPTGLIPGNLGINTYEGSLFHGGKYPFSTYADTDTYYDDIVVAKARIGCKVPKPVCRDVVEMVPTTKTVCERPSIIK